MSPVATEQSTHICSIAFAFDARSLGVVCFGLALFFRPTVTDAIGVYPLGFVCALCSTWSLSIAFAFKAGDLCLVCFGLALFI